MCSSGCYKKCMLLNNYLYNRDCNMIGDKLKYILNVCCYIYIDRELNIYYIGLLVEIELLEKLEFLFFKLK